MSSPPEEARPADREGGRPLKLVLVRTKFVLTNWREYYPIQALKDAGNAGLARA
jgi:hypothetical protein